MANTIAPLPLLATRVFLSLCIFFLFYIVFSEQYKSSPPKVNLKGCTHSAAEPDRPPEMGLACACDSLANVILPPKNMPIQSPSLFQGAHKQMVCTCQGFCLL